ncbi:MAG: glycoside hydrolase family 127 protein [Lachnospiraceae bacterium]|nr:glycoside hydrolase family 127 protein [Lachnospiraceae bacterium]
MNNEVKISDVFWNRYRHLVKHEMIPYQWDVLNDAIDISIEKERDDAFIPNEKSHAIENFKIAAKRAEGSHYGWVFQDSDVYKWLEAVAYSLRFEWDDDLKKTADEVVKLIGEAQCDDGYLHTYFTIMEPERRYRRLGESHELYCAGHYIEAAVAYHEATGDKKALDIAVKLADHICRTFGTKEGQIRGVDGHEEIEIGLLKLYHLLGKKEYLDMADFFLRERGKDPDFFEKQAKADNKGPLIESRFKFPMKYYQMHRPVEEQDTAEGHAVRLVYMCTALADLAAASKDEKLAATCKKIWRNIIDKRMYITGGIGSTVTGEAFTLDNDLPNDTMYCETCASIGLIFFSKQMLGLEADAQYADVMERALYNTALAGMALDGRHFFYVNPLEVVPGKSENDPGKSHVKAVRPEWLGCACCPPNLARLIASLDKYIYTVKDDEILVNLFIGSQLEHSYEGGNIKLQQECDYPKSGKVVLTADNEGDRVMHLKIRIPSWCDSYSGMVDGADADIETDRGYWTVSIPKGSHTLELDMKIEPRRWYSNINVSANIGKVAIARGPQVYCAEEVDNGAALHCLALPAGAAMGFEWDDDLLGGVGVITVQGIRRTQADTDRGLYALSPGTVNKTQKIKLIPYYAWANRGKNEMRVWLDEV